jgi:hypothetical protein
MASFDSAFEAGQILLEIKEQGLFEELGCATFEDVIKRFAEKTGRRRSVLWANLTVVKHFDPVAHRSLGIERLRILSREKVVKHLGDPRHLIEKGIEVAGEHGLELKPVKEFKTRALKDALDRLVDEAIARQVAPNFHEAVADILGEELSPKEQALDDGRGAISSVEEDGASAPSTDMPIAESEHPAAALASELAFPRTTLGRSANEPVNLPSIRLPSMSLAPLPQKFFLSAPNAMGLAR